MRCALVFHLLATIFVIVYSAPQLCVFRDRFEEKQAICGRDDVRYTFEFIPPISQNITLIDLADQPLIQLPYNAFRNLSSQSNISKIWLKNCQIRHVNAGALLNLHKLKIIDLSHNDITRIDSRLFRDTKQIKYIYLEYNKIEVLPGGIFHNLTRLEKVVLNDNRIHQVDKFSFRNSPLLWKIDLSDNQLEFVDIAFTETFGNDTFLLLKGNPWNCNCELRPIYEYLAKKNRLDDEELVCEKPPKLQGRKWSDISSDKFVCPSISVQYSVMTRTEQDDNVPVTARNGTILCLCVAAVIIGVVLFKRRSARRTNARNMDSDLPMPAV